MRLLISLLVLFPASVASAQQYKVGDKVTVTEEVALMVEGKEARRGVQPCLCDGPSF